MRELEMQLFEAMDCVTDALTDGIPLSDPRFEDVAKTYSAHRSDHPVIDRLVKALRKEFCNAEPG